MKTSTSYRPGTSGGRPRGARNHVKREVRALLVKLEKDGGLDPSKVFRRLQSIALGEDLGAAVAAARVLFEYRFGKAVSSIDLDVQHDLGPSVVELLEQIATSDRHRNAIEERERRLLAAVTVEDEPA